MIQIISQLLNKTLYLLRSLSRSASEALSISNYQKYRKHHKEFQRLGGKITHRHMILSDFTDQAGLANGHYFHQDLLVATFIHQKRPRRHIDIGSRVDGFVAHVAAYRPVEVFDVRDLEKTGHENIIFKKVNLMTDHESLHEITDSISCLHVIEHFGLGRYGDPIDPHGHIRGFNNILKMLKKGGTLYISFPIGNQNEVHFNAHRIFHPTDILEWADDPKSLRLESFDFVDDSGNLQRNVDITNKNIDVKYGCGIYTFSKKKTSHSKHAQNLCVISEA